MSSNVKGLGFIREVLFERALDLRVSPHGEIRCSDCSAPGWRCQKRQRKHLFLPRGYNGDPHVTIFTPWTEQEVLEHLEAGWGECGVLDLEVEFLLKDVPEVPEISD